MARSVRKVKVGSFILFSINLLSLTGEVFGAVAPVSPGIATTSSSTSPSGLPIPVSKISGSTLTDTDKSNALQQPASLTRPSAELYQQSSTSPRSEGAFTAEALNNDVAHNQQGENQGTDTSGAGEKSKLISGQKASPFVDFPPFAKPIASQVRYQRQRRSYPISSSLTQEFSPASSGPSYRFTKPDELEFRLDDDRERDAFLRLLSLVAADEAAHDDNDDDDGDDTTGGNLDDSIDLGNFQRPVNNPYWTPMLARPNEPINLMSSLLAAEPPRTNVAPHNLYGIGERPLEIGINPRVAAALQDDDDTDGEWMEDSVPLRGSHMKTRRSGNTEFTFNPVKSHFRRYLRAVPLKSGLGLEFMPSGSGGRFGAALPVDSRMRRRRRASGLPAIHWM